MIFVDEPRVLSGRIGPDGRRHGIVLSRMTTDGDIEELHTFARKPGLKPTWFHLHPNPRLNHYILLPSKRKLALEQGAQERQWEESRKRVEQTEQTEQKGDAL